MVVRTDFLVPGQISQDLGEEASGEAGAGSVLGGADVEVGDAQEDGAEEGGVIKGVTGVVVGFENCTEEIPDEGRAAPVLGSDEGDGVEQAFLKLVFCFVGEICG